MSKINDFCGDELPAQLMSAKNVLTLTYVLKSALTSRQRQNYGRRRPWPQNDGEGEEEDQDQQQQRSGAQYGWVGEGDKGRKKKIYSTQNMDG